MDRRPTRRCHASDDAGLTLVELMVTMVLFGLLVAIAAPSWRAYQRSQEESGSAQSVADALRNAQTMAVTESRAYCVRFTASTWTVWRFACGSGGTQVDSNKVQGSLVQLTGAAFQQSDGTTAADAYFYPSGKASAGSVKVTRTGSSSVYTISVEGLTSRVAMAH